MIVDIIDWCLFMLQRYNFFLLLQNNACRRYGCKYTVQFCTQTKKRLLMKVISFYVIQLGLEPRTPTLKVLCSTC